MQRRNLQTLQLAGFVKREQRQSPEWEGSGCWQERRDSGSLQGVWHREVTSDHTDTMKWSRRSEARAAGAAEGEETRRPSVSVKKSPSCLKNKNVLLVCLYSLDSSTPQR